MLNLVKYADQPVTTAVTRPGGFNVVADEGQQELSDRSEATQPRM